MSITFALPAAALGALAGLVPVAVALARTRTDRRLRRELGLGGPPLAGQLARPAAFACAFGLLGLAAAQPSIRTEHTRVARADAQMVVVLDSSRSMLASSGPTGSARYRRASAFAYRLRSALPDVPAGLSSLTNRVLPYLFPTADSSAYDLVLAKAYGIERPPPAITVEKWVTTFDPLAEVARATSSPRPPDERCWSCSPMPKRTTSTRGASWTSCSSRERRRHRPLLAPGRADLRPRKARRELPGDQPTRPRRAPRGGLAHVPGDRPRRGRPPRQRGDRVGPDDPGRLRPPGDVDRADGRVRRARAAPLPARPRGAAAALRRRSRRQAPGKSAASAPTSRSTSASSL